MSLTVIHPGLHTQVQDAGRWGWQAEGVPVGGAMDGWSHRLANALVGQGAECATLEMLMRGPVLRFDAPTCIALAGADLSPHVNGQPLPMHQRSWLPAGSELRFGARVAGLRAYLAVAGGIHVPPVLGSRSTLARSSLGGWQGRPLQAGDVLPLGAAHIQPPRALNHGVVAEPLPAGLDVLSPVEGASDGAAPRLAVVHGEQWPSFSPAAQQRFLSQAWRVSPQSDRMGYRLQGEPLPKPDCGDMLSEGVALGTIQVPPDGQPIVLMAERQTTGGYPKIAHLASVDVPRLAQLAPGQWLRFEAIGLDQAQALLEDRERSFAALCERLAAMSSRASRGAMARQSL